MMALGLGATFAPPALAQRGGDEDYERLHERARAADETSYARSRELVGARNFLGAFSHPLDVIDLWLTAHDARTRVTQPSAEAVYFASVQLYSAIGFYEGGLPWQPKSAFIPLLHRMRRQANEIRERVVSAVVQFPSWSRYRGGNWYTYTRGFCGQAVITAAAATQISTDVATAVDDLSSLMRGGDQWPPWGNALAIGHLISGRPQQALEAAARGVSRSYNTRDGNRTRDWLETVDCGTIAAVSAAKLGQWRIAWEHLLRARTEPSVRLSMQAVEARLWEHFDAIVTIAPSTAASQVWVATRDGGLDSSRVFELPEVVNGDIQRAMTVGEASADLDGWVMAAASVGDPEAEAKARDFANRATALSAQLPEGLGDALSHALSHAREQGATRVAWMPSSSIGPFPLAAMPLRDGSPALSVMQMATIASPAELERAPRAGPRQITEVRALDVAGGDEDIQFARIERDFVRRLGGAGQQRNAGAVLHVATHATLNDEGMSFLIGADRWLTVAQLRQSAVWRSPPQLVVLSACQSVIDPTDVINTTSDINSPGKELIAAGASGVVGSLWNVDDTAAFLFATRMQSELFHRQVESRVAFHTAVNWIRTANADDLAAYIEDAQQRELLAPDDADAVLGRIAELSEAVPFGHPVHWAAWVYWGV